VDEKTARRALWLAARKLPMQTVLLARETVGGVGTS
jgi:ribosomal protein L16/L10AE